MNSPAVKAFGDERLAAGETLLVVDLGACIGMDSTFMGALAGIATRFSAVDGGSLQIAEPGNRNRRSLEDLGLDFLMEIDPPASVWRGRVNEIRRELEPPQPAGALSRVQRTLHVLESHQNLTGVSDKNAREFAQVVDALEEELSGNENPVNKDPQV